MVSELGLLSWENRAEAIMLKMFPIMLLGTARVVAPLTIKLAAVYIFCASAKRSKCS